jgi:hypothetical protein
LPRSTVGNSTETFSIGLSLAWRVGTTDNGGELGIIDATVSVEWKYLWPLGRVDDTKTWRQTYRIVDGAFQIVNRQTGLALDVRGWDSRDGASVIAYPRQTDARGDSTPWNQPWYMDRSERIISLLNDKVLDIEGASLKSEANLIMYSPNGGDNQRWVREPDGRLRRSACAPPIWPAATSPGIGAPTPATEAVPPGVRNARPIIQPWAREPNYLVAYLPRRNHVKNL